MREVGLFLGKAKVPLSRSTNFEQRARRTTNEGESTRKWVRVSIVKLPWLPHFHRQFVNLYVFYAGVENPCLILKSF